MNIRSPVLSQYWQLGHDARRGVRALFDTVVLPPGADLDDFRQYSVVGRLSVRFRCGGQDALHGGVLDPNTGAWYECSDCCGDPPVAFLDIDARVWAFSPEEASRLADEQEVAARRSLLGCTGADIEECNWENGPEVQIVEAVPAPAHKLF